MSSISLSAEILKDSNEAEGVKRYPPTIKQKSILSIFLRISLNVSTVSNFKKLTSAFIQNIECVSLVEDVLRSQLKANVNALTVFIKTITHETKDTLLETYLKERKDLKISDLFASIPNLQNLKRTSFRELSPLFKIEQVYKRTISEIHKIISFCDQTTLRKFQTAPQNNQFLSHIENQLLDLINRKLTIENTLSELPDEKSKKDYLKTKMNTYIESQRLNLARELSYNPFQGKSIFQDLITKKIESLLKVKRMSKAELDMTEELIREIDDPLPRSKYEYDLLVNLFDEPVRKLYIVSDVSTERPSPLNLDFVFNSIYADVTVSDDSVDS